MNFFGIPIFILEFFGRGKLGGNRVVEQKEINKSFYSFNIPVNQKAFYLMIGLVGGKIYTEKIGLRD